MWLLWRVGYLHSHFLVEGYTGDIFGKLGYTADIFCKLGVVGRNLPLDLRIYGFSDFRNLEFS
jgi:hypothetical protein